MSDDLNVTPATRSHTDQAAWSAIMQRVRTEYEEMPGLSVTVPQAARLWNIDTPTARDVLNAMVDIGYLSAGPRGFTRSTVERSRRALGRAT